MCSRFHLLLTLLPLNCVVLPAQIRHLSTDHQGSVLYFAADMSSPQASEARLTRIYRWELGRGISTFIEAPMRFIDPGRTSAGGYGVDSPSVSADGSRIAFMQHVDCAGPGCARVRPVYGIAVVTGRSGEGPLFHVWGQEGFWGSRPARVEISRNGRFVVCRNGPFSGLGGVRDIELAGAAEDFGAAGAIDIPFSTAGTRQMLGDNGTAVWGAEGRLSVSRNPGLFARITEIDAMSPVTNADGSVVVYETIPKDGSSRLLLALDRRSGMQWFLWADPSLENPGVPLRDGFIDVFFDYPYPPIATQIFGASIDSEGRQAVILAREGAGQPRRWLVVLPLRDAPPQWLYDAGEEILETTLSGDGRAAFLATASGRLLRVDTITGEAAELLARTPWAGQVIGAAALGARNRIVGGGFVEPPVVYESAGGEQELGGVRVEYNGQTMPLFSVSSSEIVYRIPTDFDVRDRGYLLRLEAPSASSFHPIPIVRRSSRFFQNVVIEPPGAIGEDGQALNLSRPAKPGEVISILSTGWDESTVSVACVMGMVPRDLVFDVVSFGPLVDRPGLFELRARVPDGVDTAVNRTGQLLCHGGEPVASMGLRILLHR